MWYDTIKVVNMMDEDEAHTLEAHLKIAFNEDFSTLYLDVLSRDSTAKQNLVELLWLGFYRGYLNRKSEEEIMKCNNNIPKN